MNIITTKIICCCCCCCCCCHVKRHHHPLCRQLVQASQRTPGLLLFLLLLLLFFFLSKSTTTLVAGSWFMYLESTPGMLLFLLLLFFFLLSKSTTILLPITGSWFRHLKAHLGCKRPTGLLSLDEEVFASQVEKISSLDWSLREECGNCEEGQFSFFPISDIYFLFHVFCFFSSSDFRFLIFREEYGSCEDGQCECATQGRLALAGYTGAPPRWVKEGLKLLQGNSPWRSYTGAPPRWIHLLFRAWQGVFHPHHPRISGSVPGGLVCTQWTVPSTLTGSSALLMWKLSFRWWWWS